MQKRILTGIQSSGTPHLGNILGAIAPAIALSQAPDNDCFYFIADIHALTTIKDVAARQQYTQEVAAAWLACGLDSEKSTLYRQSRVSEVCELAWYLGCLTPYPMLAKAHAFKDKKAHLSEVNAGLFTYPVLMAADILLYNSHIVPVGKDQAQHLEMTCDLAARFNRRYGEVFVIPTCQVCEETQLIPGKDGRKMSKSYGNTLNVFLPEKALRKEVAAIQTDSTPLASPKNADACTVFQLYALLADEKATAHMRERYEKGGYGYGDAKKALSLLLIEKFREARERFHHYLTYPSELEAFLETGERRARKVAQQVLGDVRKALGLGEAEA